MICPRCGYAFGVDHSSSIPPYRNIPQPQNIPRPIIPPYPPKPYEPYNKCEDISGGFIRFSDSILLFSDAKERIVELKKDEFYVLAFGNLNMFEEIKEYVLNVFEKDAKIDDYNIDGLQSMINNHLKSKFGTPFDIFSSWMPGNYLELDFVSNNGKIYMLGYRAFYSASGEICNNIMCSPKIMAYLEERYGLIGELATINVGSENIINILKKLYEENEKFLMIRELKIIKNIGGD